MRSACPACGVTASAPPAGGWFAVSVRLAVPTRPSESVAASRNAYRAPASRTPARTTSHFVSAVVENRDASSTSTSGELHRKFTWRSLDVTDAASSIRAEGSTSPPLDRGSRISTCGGRAVGVGVGSGSTVVGAALGMAVGVADGAGDGANIGIREGPLVGVADGGIVGADVGAGTGSDDGCIVHVPLGQSWLEQSPLIEQVSPTLHGEQSWPPQSTSVSVPSSVPSVQLAAVGTPAGAGSGTGVGAGKGVFVGAGRGRDVGAGSGTAVGARVGDWTGIDVGAGLGTAVGDGSGTAVGAGSGIEVGAGLGTAVGDGTGTEVGAGTGTDVGELAGMPPPQEQHISAAVKSSSSW